MIIVDSSIFTTGGAVNPIATIQALALKISERILRKKMNINNKNNLIKEINSYFRDYKKFKMPSFTQSVKGHYSLKELF